MRSTLRSRYKVGIFCRLVLFLDLLHNLFIMIASKIGAHVSIAGGIWNAPQRAAAAGCEVMQIFTRSPQGGGAPALTPEIIERFAAARAEFGIGSVYIHTPYYINLGSEKPQTVASSIRIIREELERGTMLGAQYIMTHIGSAAEQDRNLVIQQVGESFAAVLKDYKGSTQLLIEISAGAGSVLGCTFGEVSKIIEYGNLKSFPGFGGICFDTCHAFASGYDYRSAESLQSMLEEFDQEIGLDLLRLTHVNDSKGACGDRKDRHEHIGLGLIGKDAMSHILSSASFSKIDWILETPEEQRFDDIQILKTIRSEFIDS